MTGEFLLEEEFGRGRAREVGSCWEGLQLNMFVKKKAMLFEGACWEELGERGVARGATLNGEGKIGVFFANSYLQSQKVLRKIIRLFPL